MKKFVKGCLITATSMFFIGIIMLIICIIIGGGSLLHYLKTETLSHNTLSNFFNNHVVTFHNGESHIDFSEHHQTHTGKHENMQVATISEIKNLNIDLGGGTCIISESSDEFFHIYTAHTNANEFQYYKEENTLYLKGFDGLTLGVSMDDHNTLYLDIPKDFSFDNIYIDLGAGYLEAHSLTASKHINLNVGAGELITSTLLADSFTLGLGAGNVEINNGIINNSELSVGFGNMIYHGKINHDLTAECGMGNLELFLNDSYEAHNYKLDCALGNMTLHEKNFSAVAYSDNIQHGTDSNYTLTCGMGNMTIHFE